MIIATKYNQLKSHLISLFEHNTDAIMLLNTDGYIIDINPAFMALAGYTKEECVNQHFLTVIGRELDDEDKRLLFNEINFLDSRFVLQTKDNKRIGCLIRFNPVKENETISGYFLTIKNMQELDKIAERYLESELNYRMIAENMHDVLILMDKDQNYLYISPSSKEIFDFDYTKMDNRDAFFNIHPDYVEELDTKFRATIEKGKAFKIKLQAYHEKRGWIWTEIKGKPIYNNNNGQFLHVLLVARDISIELEQEERLKYFAYHDTLTSLPNRRMFNEQLELAINRLHEKKRPFAVLLLDIDNFKHINDSYGHEIGDKVIVEFGSRINHIVGERGLVARLGGDEFVILIEEFVNEQQVTEIAGQINELVKQDIVIQHAQLEITTSIGISICHHETCTASQILRYADEALYNVKGRGKDTFSVYTAK